MSQDKIIPDISHEIVYVRADILNPAEYNPRKHTPKQIEHLKESIKRYGLVDPIIANRHPDRMNIVIGGRFRLKVVKELGMMEVPVIYLDLDIDREKELNLRLNQNTGEWDFELLKDLDLGLLLDVGFDNSELSAIWDDMLGVEEDGFDVEKELESIVTPTAKLGDIYALGEHRIMCGDSTNEEDVRKLFETIPPDSNISMFYYDPPYNIGLDYSKGLSNGKSYGGKKTDDTKSKEDYFLFLEKALHNGLRYAEKDTHIFMWCDPNMIGLIQSLYESLGVLPRRVCLWIKNNMNATPNVAFNRSYEPCVYGTKGKPSLSTEFRNLHEVLDKEVGVGKGMSGRAVQRFLLEETPMRTRSGKPLVVSAIYTILNNPMYYGTYEYPRGSGNWCKGNYEPIITKELFDEVQDQLNLSPRYRPRNKNFEFTKIMKCGLCGSGITAQEKFKKILGQKDPRSYVYYHCSKCHDHKCKNPMIREDALILQLLEMLDDIDINTISVGDSLKEEIRRYNLFQSQLLKKDSRDVVSAKQINLREYMKYMISNGSKDEKREILGMIQADIILKDKKVYIEKSGSFKVS